MLYSYNSKSLAELVHPFFDVLKTSKKNDPFKRPWVVVQNKEMQQWLTLQVATKLGIAANIEFILPSELMWKLYRVYNPEMPKILPTDRLPLQWRIFDFFLELEENERSSINGLPHFKDEPQAFQLAAQIADVFDLYQMYRPEMLQDWKSGKLSTSDSNEYWQLWLWRALKLKSNTEIPDRSEAFVDLLSKFESEAKSQKILPNEILVFGLSHFPKPFINLISALSSTIDCHFFVQEFASGGNDIFNIKWNLLNEEWGLLKSDSIKCLKLNKSNILKINKEDSVFTKLRNGVQARKIVELHSCHSPKREAEVLKNRLLSELDSDKNLKPEEILVLVPDMDTYSHILKNKFSFSENETALPIYAPKAYLDESQLGFLELLELLSGEVKATAFIEVLETDIFKQRYSLNEDDLILIRNWFVENHIHFGLDNSDSSFSLEKLIEALNIGYSTEAGDFQLYGDTAPSNGLNSTDQLRLIARLSSCIQFLKQARITVNRSRKAIEWMDIFKRWMNELQNAKQSSFLSLLDHIRDNILISDSKSFVEFSMIKKWMLTQLKDVQATSSGLGHGVVLSSYIPYRSIPFKMIAILGMNESTFPRKSIRPTFDLIYNDPQPGERITKKDDELLFLELLHSAQNKLYISYLGQDQYSENVRLPSILVQKLLDIIEETGDKVNVIKEKLHGFDQSYFIAQESYSNRFRELSKRVKALPKSRQLFITEKLKNQPLEEKNIIQLNDLILFFVHPSKYISTNILDISEAYSENQVDDREIFSLNGLDKYKLDEVIFDGFTKNISETTILNYSKARGIIPEGIAGIEAFNSEKDVIKELLTKIKDIGDSTPKKVNILVNVGDYQVQGTIDNVFESNLVLWRTGKERAKDLVQVWLKHLFLVKSGNIDHSFLVCKEKDKIEPSTSVFKEINDLDSILKTLIEWYLEGLNSFDSLCFFPETSKEYYEKYIQDQSKAEDAARKKWVSSNFSKGEGDDFYNKLIWREIDPLKKQVFEDLSLRFWKPLLDSRGKI